MSTTERKPIFVAMRFRDLPEGAVHIWFDEQHCCERLAWKVVDDKGVPFHVACRVDLRKAKIEWKLQPTDSINEMVLAQIWERKAER